MRMSGARNWTAEEETYLKEAWGNASIPYIAQKLNRSETAIQIRAQRLGLGAFTENGDYITYLQLLRALHKNSHDAIHSYTWTRELWVRNGLKIRQKRVGSSRVYIIDIQDFWAFAEKNKHLFDFSRMEKNALGAEPSWVSEKRRLDQLASINNATQSKWTPYELSLLKLYANQPEKHTVQELAKNIGRSEGAVLRKCRELGYSIKIRKNKIQPFSEEELLFITQEIIKGSQYSVIADKLGRSEKSLRGAVYQRLGTENINKAQKLLSAGAELPYKPHNISQRKDMKSNGNTETFTG